MVLRYIDLFGCDYKMTVFNKAKYKTVHGGLLTVFCLIIIGGVTFLFGADFFFKRNPNVFSKQIVDDEEQSFVKVSNKELSILTVLEDEFSVSVEGEDQVIFPFIEHVKWLKDEQNEWYMDKITVTTPKTCSQTTNKDNEMLSKHNLDKWKCIDWDEVEENIGEQPYLGGQWEGDMVWGLRIIYLTCPFHYSDTSGDISKCSTFTKIQEKMVKRPQYVSFLLPTYIFDSTNFGKPVKVTYEQRFRLLNSELAAQRYFYFDYETIFDDKGWILEDTTTLQALSFSREETIIKLVKPEHFASNKNQLYSINTFYIEKIKTVRFRAYIKVQELVANIGGIIKIAVMLCKFVSQYLAEKLRNNEIVAHLELKSIQEVSNMKNNITIRHNESRGSIKALKKREIAVNKNEWELLLIIKRILRVGSFQKQVERERKAENLLDKLDIIELLKDKENRAN